MGYDPARFDGPVDDELLCPVCRFVLEDPVQVRQVSSQSARFLYCGLDFRLHPASMLFVDRALKNGFVVKTAAQSIVK